MNYFLFIHHQRGIPTWDRVSEVAVGGIFAFFDNLEHIYLQVGVAFSYSFLPPTKANQSWILVCRFFF